MRGDPEEVASMWPGGGHSTGGRRLCQGSEAGIRMTCLGILSRFMRMEHKTRKFQTPSPENSGGSDALELCNVTASGSPEATSWEPAC